MSLKAIIFDMDGVIIDSEPQHARAALAVLQRYGAQADLDFCRSFIGSSTLKMSQVAIEQYHMKVTIEELLAAMNQEKKILATEEGYLPVPGVIELIKQLYQAGFHLAIASSSSFEEIQHVVDTLQLRPYFQKLVSSSHVKNPKPAPDVFLLALEQLEVTNEEALVIEDSYLGTLASKAAGIPFVGFYNPGSGNQSLAQAAIVVEDFASLDPAFFHTTWKRSWHLPVTIASQQDLTLREMTVADVSAAWQICQEKEVRRYITDMKDDVLIEEQKMKLYIQEIYSFYEYGLWGIFYQEKLIGRCGLELHQVNGKDEIMLSYYLSPEYWHQGLAYAACQMALHYAKEHLELHRIIAVIEKGNQASLALARRLSMTYEADSTYLDTDSEVYSLSL